MGLQNSKFHVTDGRMENSETCLAWMVNPAVPVSLLANRNNVIAVEVHQSDRSSTASRK